MEHDTESEAPADPRLEVLAELLGFRFRNPALALQALRHASVGGVDRSDNERLEFLGDAFLGLAVAEYLYIELPAAREGELTEKRSRLVSRAHLAAIARLVKLDTLVETRPASTPETMLQGSILAGTLEALIGAVFIDGGPEAAGAVTRRLLSHIPEVEHRQNPKTELQHFSQLKFGRTPNYRVELEWAHTFGRTFRVSASVSGRQFAPGWGRSKREAEQNAAREALIELRNVSADADVSLSSSNGGETQPPPTS